MNLFATMHRHSSLHPFSNWKGITASPRISIRSPDAVNKSPLWDLSKRTCSILTNFFDTSEAAAPESAHALAVQAKAPCKAGQGAEYLTTMDALVGV